MKRVFCQNNRVLKARLVAGFEGHRRRKPVGAEKLPYDMHHVNILKPLRMLKIRHPGRASDCAANSHVIVVALQPHTHGRVFKRRPFAQLLQGNGQRRREADDGAHLFAQVAELQLASSLKSNVYDAL